MPIADEARRRSTDSGKIVGSGTATFLLHPIWRVAIERHPRRPRWLIECEARAAAGGRGGTGRRAGFRFQCCKSWGFESLRPHQWCRSPETPMLIPRATTRAAGLEGLRHAGDGNFLGGI